MSFQELADFGDVASDGFALGAGFFEGFVELGGFGFTIDVYESFEFFLVIDEVGDKSGFGLG